MRLLIVDHDAVIVRTVAEGLATWDWTVHAVASVPEALNALDEFSFDAILLKARLRNSSSLSLLEDWSGEREMPPTIIMCDREDISSSVNGMRLGAADVVTLPIVATELEARLERVLDVRSPRAYAEFSNVAVTWQEVRERLLGESPSMRAIRSQVTRLAAYPYQPVMILGEPGVGREHVARRIHGATHPDEPFRVLRCNLEAPGNLNAQLNGNARVEPAILRETGQGTVYLADLDALQPSLQESLARLIDDKVAGRLAPGPRFIVSLRPQATAIDPLMRQFARFSLVIPPLRERPEDVPLLAQHYLLALASKHPFVPFVLPDAAFITLASYPWPNNLPELFRALRQAALQSTGGEVNVKVLEQLLLDSATSVPIRKEGAQGSSGLRALERDIIFDAYRSSGHSLSRAAKMIGMPRSTLRDKLRRYGIR